jgi:octaprenyl-diphosphate synthase
MGGLDYAKKHLAEYHQKALDVLNSLPATQSKDSLVGLLDYVITRKK